LGGGEEGAVFSWGRKGEKKGCPQSWLDLRGGRKGQLLSASALGGEKGSRTERVVHSFKLAKKEEGGGGHDVNQEKKPAALKEESREACKGGGAPTPKKKGGKRPARREASEQ